MTAGQSQRSIIVAHPDIDRTWPWAADHFRVLWEAQGQTEYLRLAPDDRRAVCEIVADPAGVTRLVALNVPVRQRAVLPSGRRTPRGSFRQPLSRSRYLRPNGATDGRDARPGEARASSRPAPRLPGRPRHPGGRLRHDDAPRARAGRRAGPRRRRVGRGATAYRRSAARPSQRRPHAAHRGPDARREPSLGREPGRSVRPVRPMTGKPIDRLWCNIRTCSRSGFPPSWGHALRELRLLREAEGQKMAKTHPRNRTPA